MIPEFLRPMRINPAIIGWARERLTLSIADAAELLGLNEQQLEAWENATGEPTYMQAINLARKLQFPFGYLFLSGTPKSDLPLPDLRTVGGAAPGQPSPNLLIVLEDAIRKQHWYAELLRDENATPNAFVSKFSIADKTERIAADIRETLEITDQTRAECSSVSAFMTRLVRSAEDIGVIVLRSGTVLGNPHKKLSIDEFRGFALLDKLAPLVFINSRDALVAQLFTFTHEVAHIWIGAEGVSNPDFWKRSEQQVNAIEVKCNQIAAEVLVPSPGFARLWDSQLSIDANVSNLRMRYRVSRFVILRKALDLELVTETEYKSKLNQFYEVELKKRDEKEDSSGNYYNNLFARNSNKLTAAVTHAVYNGKLLATEACNLLGIRLGVLGKISVP